MAPRAIPSELPAINFSVSAARGSLLFSVGPVNANGSNHSVARAIRIFRSSPESRVPLKILCADQRGREERQRDGKGRKEEGETRSNNNDGE